jgi:3-hydroxyacyl-CoA dehydrogenase/enoyl-CoA hydratase/3-hydroxybutyryl-CoA epimerase
VIEDGVAWLWLDDPGKKVNTLSSRFFGWFDEQLSRLESEDLRGLVILSGKRSNFVAGADIEELQSLSTQDEVLDLLERGHEMICRFEALPYPTVAAIHGSCLGGGLELALACDRRVATDDDKTKLGLPEVQLGLIPGLGGTQRLPRLIGVPDALDMILTGKQVRARKARSLGLVDEICHPYNLGDAAVQLLDAAAEALAKKRQRGRGLASRAGDWLAKTPLGDKLVYDKAREKVMKKSGGHYPAPLVAIKIVRDGLELPLPRALELESGAFSELVVSDTAKSLMGIFFMKNDVEARAGKIAAAAREIGDVGVLGAGFMGSGIAQVLAYKDVRVVMKDKDHESLARGMAYANDRFEELVRRRRYTEVDLKQAMGRILGTVDYGAFAHTDFVVEAVFEDVDLKHRVIRETEAAAPDNLIFASNTSTIPIARLAEASRRPENVVGMHFFSPVHKMPLLEVIRHPKTSKEALATTVALGRRMGKTVIVVDDGPGFFTSRVLGPFINEAAWILTEGATVEQIDKALTAWGWPVGPITLLDEVGLDIAHHVSGVMTSYFGDRVAPPPVFASMAEDGRTGRKGGRGFYLYDKGKKKEVDPAVYGLIDWEPAQIDSKEILERCWMQMLNETALCIEDGVIANPNDIDIGVIFGFGFPPFRGGILREADRLGLGYVVDRLEGYAARHGSRLEPAELLRTMAKKGERFHKE